MEFQHAIESHLAWKQSLFRALRHGDGESAAALGMEEGAHCHLGSWIELRIGASPGVLHLEQLRDLHLAFHRVASLAIQRGHRGTPSQRMLLDGRLQELSDRITENLTLLRIHLRSEPHVESAAETEP